MRRPVPRLVITCEHASCAVPRELAGLGLPASVLRQHVGWDPGALPVARALAREFDAPLVVGEWSRLVADLNRSEDHPRVVAERAHGHAIPGNRIDAAGRDRRLARYWRPWRRRVERLVAQTVARVAGGAGAPCTHLSVHSFVPELNGVVRRNDVGLLFDPRRDRERAFVVALQRELRRLGLSVRKNFPYFGHTDGMTSHLRARLPRDGYLGIEIELNQRVARQAAGQRRLTAALVAALRAVLGGATSR